MRYPKFKVTNLKCEIRYSKLKIDIENSKCTIQKPKFIQNLIQNSIRNAIRNYIRNSTRR